MRKRSISTIADMLAATPIRDSAAPGNVCDAPAAIRSPTTTPRRRVSLAISSLSHSPTKGLITRCGLKSTATSAHNHSGPQSRADRSRERSERSVVVDYADRAYHRDLTVARQSFRRRRRGRRGALHAPARDAPTNRVPTHTRGPRTRQLTQSPPTCPIERTRF